MTEAFNPAELKRRDSERLRRYRELLDFYHGLQRLSQKSSNQYENSIIRGNKLQGGLDVISGAKSSKDMVVTSDIR